MRVVIDGVHTPVDEFIQSLGSPREPVELVRDGRIVFVMSALKAGEAGNGGQREKKRAVAAARVKALVEKAWAFADVHGVSEREARKLAKKARKEVRSGLASRSH